MKKTISTALLTSLILLGILNTSCKKNKNVVVVYTSVDQVFSEPILKDFEKDTGIKVQAVFDTEETKSTGVLNRIIAEKNNTRCDVFWSGDPVRPLVLKSKGITTSYVSAASKDISKNFQDRQHHFQGFSARARILLYNSSLIKKQNLPKSILDLSKPEYKGKFAIANPLFGTTSFHFAALFTQLGDQKAKEFFSDLKKNKVIIATSNGDVKRRIIKGEIAFGIVDTDDAHEAEKENANIKSIFLNQNSFGTLIIPNTVSLLKNSKHPKNAKRLIDYLLSKETEKKLALSCAQIPLHKNVKTPASVYSLDKIKAMKLNYEKTANKLTALQNYFKKWIE